MDLEDRLEPLNKFRVQPTPARAVEPLVEMNSVVTMGYHQSNVPLPTKSKKKAERPLRRRRLGTTSSV